MKTFTDTAGDTWTIALTLGSAMAVKDALGIDLLQPEAGYPGPGDPPLLTRLGTDELLLGEMLCALLENQFEARGVTARDIRNRFDGRTLLHAQKAFYEEVVDFFHQRGRADRAKAVAKQIRMIEAAVAFMETKIDGIDVEQTITDAMHGPATGTGTRPHAVGGAMSGSWPEPSASIPGR